MKRRTAAIYILLVFASGALAGIFGQRLYTLKSVNAGVKRAKSSPEEHRRRHLEQMRTRLNLSPEQTAKLQEIHNNTKKRYDEVHERARPEYKAIFQNHVQQVKSILTESQVLEYDKLREEREKRRKSRDGC
jgi:Spy/CpxP family protein refolding chaperone